jgi:hypothetical protein
LGNNYFKNINILETWTGIVLIFNSLKLTETFPLSGIYQLKSIKFTYYLKFFGNNYFKNINILETWTGSGGNPAAALPEDDITGSTISSSGVSDTT